MAVARKDVVLSSGWDEDQFRRMGALDGSGIQYRTLPVVRYDNINGQDVNIIDPAAIKAEVTSAFGDSSSATTVPSSTEPSPSTVVDVINASNTSGLASRLAHTLKKDGYTTGAIRDRVRGEPTTTTIEYAPGAETDARSLATVLGIDAPDKPNRSLEFGHVEVIVDDNYSAPSASQNETSSASSEDETPSASSLSGSYGYHQSSTDTDTTETTPDQGAPIDGGGVPCVN
jgi:hypothetical protein